VTNFLQVWPAIVFGWPAVVLALALSATGIVRMKPVLLLIALILVAPISLYIAGSPRFWWLGISIPLFLAGASIAIHYRRNTLAWGLLVPVIGIFGGLAVLVAGE
jgi:hypothetical protein